MNEAGLSANLGLGLESDLRHPYAGDVTRAFQPSAQFRFSGR
ncbi:hypothetical protein [Achromobacter sp.]